MNPLLIILAMSFAIILYFAWQSVKLAIELHTERKMHEISEDHLYHFRQKYFNLYAQHEQTIKKWQRIAAAK